MLTSRRLVLASAAIVLGLSACGSAHTTSSGAAGGGTDGSVTVTTGATGGPKVITFGAAGSGATTAASASADKMMAIRNVTYVFDGAMPALSDSGASWQSRAASLRTRAGSRPWLRRSVWRGRCVSSRRIRAAAGWPDRRTTAPPPSGLGRWSRQLVVNPAPAPVATISACASPAYDPTTPVDSTGDGVDATMVTTTAPPCPSRPRRLVCRARPMR